MFRSGKDSVKLPIFQGITALSCNRRTNIKEITSMLLCTAPAGITGSNSVKLTFGGKVTAKNRLHADTLNRKTRLYADVYSKIFPSLLPLFDNRGE